MTTSNHSSQQKSVVILNAVKDLLFHNSKRLHKPQNLRIAPIRSPNKSPPDIPLPVDDESLRPARRRILLRRNLLRIPNRREIHMPLHQKSLISRLIFINAHRQNRILRMLMMKFKQRRQLLNARRTPTPPEIQQHYLPPITCKMNRCPAVLDGKVRRSLANLLRMASAVAAAG